jgi:hypothetical protein
MSGLPGFQKHGPIRLAPGQNALEIVLDRDEEAAIFDLVTTTAEELSLTLPNGQTIDSSIGKQGTVSWITTTLDKIDPAGALRDIGGILLRDEGTHHVVTFENTPKGRYQIRAVNRPDQVTAAFIPFARIMKGATDAITAPPQLAAGQTRIQPYALPYDAKVGDKITASIGILGEALSNPQFVVHMEYRQIVTRDPLQFSAPEVETVPTVFTPDSDGRYTGTIVPRRPGYLRVGVQVSGRRPNGQPFSEETILTEVTVTPVVARFVGLTEQAIDSDGNGTLDRLEVTAKLEVIEPGEFEMRLSVSGPDHSFAGMSVRKKLAAGEQTLTASLSAEDVWKELADGSWTIGPPQIFRPEGNSFGEFVAVPETGIATKPYKLNDWDRGAAYGERIVTARGIRPASSGKFRSLEVLWDVTTPGTTCNWEGRLISSDNTSAELHLYGRLPAGRSTLSFVFDSTLITSNTMREWTFMPSLYCQDVKVPEERPLFIKLALNPSDYETRNEPFLVEASVIHLSPGQSGHAELVAIGKGNETITFRVIGTVPGLTLRIPDRSTKRDRDAIVFVPAGAATTIAPGRYFLPVEAIGTNGTATTELVVDVTK